MSRGAANAKRCELTLMALNKDQKATISAPHHPSLTPHPVRWFHEWEDRILIENWIPIRFQPILYSFLFAGILFVLAKRPTLPAMTAAVGATTAYIWLVLALVCPPILFTAWLMIRWGTGRTTYRGYYLRFAADIGQSFSFAAWLIGLTSDPTPETEDAYAWIVLASILAFLIILVVRDVLKLVLLERASTAVQDVQDIQHAADVAEAKTIQDILDARDAQYVDDAQSGRETPQETAERNQDDIEHLKTRADDSQARESEWSKHRDHKADDAGS